MTVWIQVLLTLLDHVFLWVVSAGPHLSRVENDSLGITGETPGQPPVRRRHGDGGRRRQSPQTGYSRKQSSGLVVVD